MVTVFLYFWLPKLFAAVKLKVMNWVEAATNRELAEGDFAAFFYHIVQNGFSQFQ